MIPRRKPVTYKREFFDIVTSLFKGKLISGEDIEEFEKAFAQYLGLKYAIGVSSGRSAFELLLRSLKLQDNDEVVFPAYTLKVLPEICRRMKLRPVFADIETDTLNISAEALKSKLNSRTRAVIATHLFGNPCNLKDILELIKGRGITVIEDCAHACGARYNNRNVGTYGLASFFSFSIAKPINTFGGGMIATDNEHLINSIYADTKLIYPKSLSILYMITLGYLEAILGNSQFYKFIFTGLKAKEIGIRFYKILKDHLRIQMRRISNIQATIGKVLLQSLEDENRLRQCNAGALLNLINPKVKKQRIMPGNISPYFFFVIRTNKVCDLKEISKDFAKMGVDVGVKEEIMDNCVSDYFEDREYPATSEVFNTSIQIPLYSRMTMKQIHKIGATVNQILEKRDLV